MTLYLQLVAVLSLFDAPPQVCSGCAEGLCISCSEGSVSGLQQEPHILVHPWLLVGVCGYVVICFSVVSSSMMVTM